MPSLANMAKKIVPDESGRLSSRSCHLNHPSLIVAGHVFQLCRLDRHPVCSKVRHALGDVTSRNGMRCWRHLRALAA